MCLSKLKVAISNFCFNLKDAICDSVKFVCWMSSSSFACFIKMCGHFLIELISY
ncbi:hypothetical protein M153_189000680 [Pseudoloma neurophilia]|uniref:Uncharacterized protein n=1 Tax=Pseudoloma neurophilia TaxID=146866 RepID=A0A0R0LZV6_9MICR|nr:hypothetical protein M153_189000680 [Pseudoloma neurophilia]